MVLLGMGGGILANIYLHIAAPSPGCMEVLGLVHVCSTWGWYATIVLVMGAFAMLVGIGMVWLGLQLPAAALRLFDTEGRYPPDPAEP